MYNTFYGALLGLMGLWEVVRLGRDVEMLHVSAEKLPCA
jgi:hypothetical protein